MNELNSLVFFFPCIPMCPTTSPPYYSLNDSEPNYLMSPPQSPVPEIPKPKTLNDYPTLLLAQVVHGFSAILICTQSNTKSSTSVSNIYSSTKYMIIMSVKRYNDRIIYLSLFSV